MSPNLDTSIARQETFFTGAYQWSVLEGYTGSRRNGKTSIVARRDSVRSQLLDGPLIAAEVGGNTIPESRWRFDAAALEPAGCV
jgi:hypothetical protein